MKTKFLNSITFLIVFLTIGVNSQNSSDSINNLEHPEWYAPVPLGNYGDVLKMGEGKKHLILVTGMGFDHSIFIDFMMRNKDKYTTYAFTAAGYGGTIAPKIPKVKDYGKRIWSSAFEEAVINYMKKEGYTSNVNILGFFIQGAQHAIHIAHKEPKVFSKMILVGSELKRDFGTPISLSKRADIVTNRVSVKWFKTVSPKTW